MMTDRDFDRLTAANERAYKLAKRIGRLSGTLSVLEATIDAHLKVYGDKILPETQATMDEMLVMIKKAVETYGTDAKS